MTDMKMYRPHIEIWNAERFNDPVASGSISAEFNLSAGLYSNARLTMFRGFSVDVVVWINEEGMVFEMITLDAFVRAEVYLKERDGYRPVRQEVFNYAVRQRDYQPKSPQYHL